MFKRLMLLIIGSALFAGFLYQARVREAIGSVVLIKPSWLIVLIMTNLCIPLLKMMRWQTILSKFGISFEKSRMFGAVSAGFFLGLVTPGTSGELGRAMTTDMNKTIGVSTVFFEKLFDLAVLLLIAVSALTIHYFARSISFLTSVFLWSGFVLLLFISSKKNGTIEKWGRLAVRNILPNRWKAKAVEVQDIFNSLVKNFSLSVRCVVYSLVLWIVPGVQFCIIARSLGIDANFEMVLTSFFVPYLAGIISLIPLGLGVLDFSIAGIMTRWYGVSPALGNASVIAFRLLITFALVIWGFGWYWYAILSKARSKGVVLADEICRAKDS